jgi:hypothetical protein
MEVTAIIVLYPGSYNWDDSYQYDIPAGLTYSNVDSDNQGDDLVAGSDYRIYWRAENGDSGFTAALNLQDGSTYPVG